MSNMPPLIPRRLSRAAAFALGFTVLSVPLMAVAEPPNPFAQPDAERSSLIRPAGPAPVELRVDTVLARVLAASDTPVLGATLPVALVLQHDPGWHTYWQNPGDSGLPTRTTYQLRSSAGETVELEASEIRWPTPSRFPVGPLSNYGYADRVLLAQDLRLPAELPAGFLDGAARLELQAEWLVCKDVCIPGQASLSLPLTVSPAAASTPTAQPPAWLQEVAQHQPVSGPEALQVGLSQDRSRLVVWSADSRSVDVVRAALEGGVFMTEVEGLVVPSAAQPLQQTADGWRLELPLGPRAERLLPSVESAGQIQGVWRQETDPARAGQAWRAVWVEGPAPEPVATLHNGLTAEQAYGLTKTAGGSGGGASQPPVETSLLAAAGLALLGGLLLNLMPCVFPVLGLKALSLAGLEDAAGARRQAFFFAVGVIASMLALAGLLLGLRAAGEAVGWGFQLQSPWVVAGLILLFTTIGINLLGAFEWGTSATRLGNLEAGQPHGPKSALFSGLLTVVVATPCTAPFMGAALGYAVAAGTLQAVTVFLFLAIGLALPTVLLTLSPGLRGRLPRPGPWMETLKQFLAFPMFATVAWLAWVFATQQGVTALLWILFALVGLGLGLWAYGLRQRSARNGTGSLVALFVGLLLAAGFAGFAAQQPSVLPSSSSAVSATDSGGAASAAGELPWQTWAPGLPERLAGEGKVVLVDFTATWCITCQANKIRVLQAEPVRTALQADDVVILKADWTRQDPLITQELNRFGRTGVPLNVVYSPKGSEPQVLSEWLTSDGVLDALAKARR